jgi:prepilin-type N-terminal cleavage/methylation domain-containing protein
MSRPIRPAAHRAQAGFTLIEVLVALTILVTALTIVYSTVTTTLKGWKAGTDAMTELHHSDFVMDQIVAALRSTAFFDSAPHLYGFRLEANTGGKFPADRMSWVTTSSAFLPVDSPWADGLHRVVVGVERTSEGSYGVAVRAMPHLSEEPDDSEDPWFVTTRVQGLRCRIYDEETTSWMDEWEDTNAVPSLVEITLYMDAPEPYDPPIRMVRAIEIPVAPAVTGIVSFTESDL